jgi:hypothetical protein
MAAGRYQGRQSHRRHRVWNSHPLPRPARWYHGHQARSRPRMRGRPCYA